MTDRLRKDAFYDKLAPFDRDGLKKLLWQLYWRGGRALQTRIVDLLDPERPKRRKVELPDGDLLLDDVERFVALARSGAYMGGSREVSRQERSKWRVTFRRLLEESSRLLEHGLLEHAAPAMEALLSLANTAQSIMLFHSEDPVAAMRLVFSDRVRILWTAYLAHEGFPTFAERGAAQLVRWESAFGWTRYGEGWVAEREASLASTLADVLKGHDAWVAFADAYLAALDGLVPTPDKQERKKRGVRQDDRRRRYAAETRTRDLAEWNNLVLDRLHGSEDDHLDRLVQHPALMGPERTFLEARLAYLRGNLERARERISACLDTLPGHQGFLALAGELGVVVERR